MSAIEGEVVSKNGRSYGRVIKRPWFEAFKLYLHDANKLQLIRIVRVFLVLLAGYAPIAILDDFLAPFTFGLPIIDDLEIPLGIIAAIKLLIDVRKYQYYDLPNK